MVAKKKIEGGELVTPDSRHLHSKLHSFTLKQIHKVDFEDHIVLKKGLRKCCTTSALERLQGTEYQFFRAVEWRLPDHAVLKY